jgi:hypothetical protein
MSDLRVYPSPNTQRKKSLGRKESQLAQRVKLSLPDVYFSMMNVQFAQWLLCVRESEAGML